MSDIAVFLCDLTGNMALPWAQAGVTCYCVDTQHSVRVPRIESNIHFIYGDARTWRPPAKSRVVFGAAFPVCTHVSGSGARDWAIKGGAMLRDSIELFDACRHALAWSGAPYMVENPVGYFSTIPHIGKPDFYFHPWHYTAFETDDHYTKNTCLWTGNGFVMPPMDMHPALDGFEPDDRIHKASPGDDRGGVRSATPLGFSLACFKANQWVLE